LVNLAVARHAQAPCLLAGDIDRGGIFAQLLGTLWLLDESDQNLIKALVVNKFRGDLSLFSDGISMLEDRSGKPVLGVIPFITQHLIPDEDAAAIVESPPEDDGLLDAVVIHLPHISNFDDFDALRAEPGVHVRFVNHPDQLGRPDVVFLPGTKNTLGDLDWLFVNGLADRIKSLASEGCSIVGFCGGFQMLGSRVADEHGLESGITHLPGLELLPLNTQLQPEKVVTRSKARLISESGFFKALQGTLVEGYEIHLGRSRCADALMQIVSRQDQAISAPDGASSPDGRIWGCHLHGLLENDRFRRVWLESLGVRPSPSSFVELRGQAYDHLADVLQECLDIDLLDRIIEEGV
jgi:adenosylcobyric acid synthase